MKHKAIVLATFLTASLAIGSTAQAHEDYGYPIGLLSGVILGLSLDYGDHYYYRDYPPRHYHHREYRRHDSHGYQHGDHNRHDHGGHRGHDRRH